MTDRFEGSPDAAETGPLLPASVRSGLLSLRIELEAPPAQVWTWLTQPGLLAQWSPVVPDHELVTIGPASARETPGSDAGDATVLEAIEPFRLVHRWGSDTLTWQLAPADRRTHLQLVDELSDRERFAESAAGWHVCLSVLADRLAGGTAPRRVGMDALAAGWERLRNAYRLAIVPNDADE